MSSQRGGEYTVATAPTPERESEFVGIVDRS